LFVFLPRVYPFICVKIIFNMKKYLTFLFSLGVLCMHAQVGVGTSNPHPSAALDVSSTTGGLLVPSMTQAQRDAISSPATGLLVFQTDGTSGFYYYTGSQWALTYRTDDLGNHKATQDIDLNGKVITDKTYSTVKPLTIETLGNAQDIQIRSADEIYITTINLDDNSTTDPNGTVYSTSGDIELTSYDEIILTTLTNDIDLVSGEDVNISSSSSTSDFIRLTSANSIRIVGELRVYSGSTMRYKFPTTAPTAGQILMANASTPTTLEWVNLAFLTDGSNQFAAAAAAAPSPQASDSLPAANNPGDMMFWNGSAWTRLNAGSQGQVLTFCNGLPTWTTNGSCDQ
jgi:hypothetical protein